MIYKYYFMKNKKIIFGILFMFLLFSFCSIVTASGTVPVLSNESPTDNLSGVDILKSTVNVTIYDLEETFNWTIQGKYITNAGVNGASNGSKSANTITPLPYNTEVIWYVNVTDGTNWSNATYSFTTRTEQRLTEHFTDPSKILLAGLVAIILLLGLVLYAIDSFIKGTFEFKTFITLFFGVVVITVVLSFL